MGVFAMAGIEGVVLEGKDQDGGLPKELQDAIIKEFATTRNRSDALGLQQLCFHLGCALACAWMVSLGRQGSWGLLILGELCFGVVASFYFNAFHETIHNTAFATRWSNELMAYILGFLTLRGKEWYLLFHWTHHRYTNDPEKDPELSGSTADRTDFTANKSLSAEVVQYLRFLTGYPFGFERIPGVFSYAMGKKPAGDFWVTTPKHISKVRQEYTVWVCLYFGIAVAATCWPETVLAPLFYYWFLPHCIGAAHLRYYQTAEHRSCHQGPFTDTTAWICSRTTASWWFYTQLAWNMPYHAEHHAWPNIPFHELPKVHAKIAPVRPKSGCTPDGDAGYLGLHWRLIQKMLISGQTAT